MTPNRPLCALAILLAAPAALGQTPPPPDDRNIAIQLFEPALGPHAFLTVAGAEVMSPGQFQLALGVTYMTHPFSVFVVGADNGLMRNSEVVSSIFAGSLSFAYGLSRSLQLGAQLPVILSMEGQGLESSTGMPEPGGLSVRGLGDARIEGTWRLYERSRSVLSIIPAVTVPSAVKLGSDDEAFLGEKMLTFRPRVAWQWTSPGGRASTGANLGVIVRKPRTLYSSRVGQQLTYGAAAALHLTRRVDLLAEVFGRKGFAADLDESPLEVDGALRVSPGGALTILAGGGTGIIKGVGSPAMRVFAAVSWSPDFRDSDGDGISNMNDKCPLQPEDKDGFQDADGCPDLDNDGDGVPDDQDRCPNEPEDLDGFMDDDGCPDLDNDGDGIPDDRDSCPDDAEDGLPPRADDGCPREKTDSDGDGVPDDKDQCPDEFEDMDGFQDDDGCPDPDNDGDGIPDVDDRCPNEPEDKDGFQDDDGCPDPDNDDDGVLDARDRCPNEAETINGVRDEDGCPDSGGKALARLQGNRLVLEEAPVFDGTRPRSRSQNLLDQVAVHLRRGSIARWRVSVAADSQATAQRRAEELKAYFVRKGVPAAKLETEGTLGPAAVTITVLAFTDGRSVTEEPVIEIEPTP
jgi:OmpA-OmpF porin, OOP family